MPAPLETYGHLTVLRDDLVFGGTKRIALEAWLPTLGAEHFIYAGSVFGWGAPALAAACQALGLHCTVLIARSTYIPPWHDALTRLPATVEWTDALPIAHLNEEAASYDGLLLPPGFAHPGFTAALIARARTLLTPARAWVPVVSGTLLTALEQAWPDTEFHGVCVAKHHGYRGMATLHHAPEKFAQPARHPPPYPSCSFSDAKLWQFAAELGTQGDLLWNTNP